MGPRQSYKFLNDNREAFIKLTAILREADTVRANAYDKYSPEVRKLAIELTERWITEVFNIAKEGKLELPKEEAKGVFFSLEDDLNNE